MAVIAVSAHITEGYREKVLRAGFDAFLTKPVDLDQMLEILPRLKNHHIVITHVSRRTGPRKARRFLAKRVGEEQMKNIHFLMDFEGSADAGEVEDVGPPPADTAE